MFILCEYTAVRVRWKEYQLSYGTRVNDEYESADLGHASSLFWEPPRLCYPPPLAAWDDQKQSQQVKTSTSLR